MPRKPSDITATDQFCGAGGSSSGATAAGVRLVMALNHWERAIQTHSANFPQAGHHCTDIQACDPRRYPSTNILITSPECFPAGTLILTAKGLTPIEEVKVGDRVLTHKSRWRLVTETMQNKTNQIVAIKGQGHYGLETTPDHPIWVTKSGFQAPAWIPASEVRSYHKWASPIEFGHPLPIPEGPAGYDLTLGSFWRQAGNWVSHEMIPSGSAEAKANLEAWLSKHFGAKGSPKAIPSWVLTMQHDHLVRFMVGMENVIPVQETQSFVSVLTSKSLAISYRLISEALGYKTFLSKVVNKAGEVEYHAQWDSLSGRTKGQRHSWNEVESAVTRDCAETVVYNLSVEEDESYVADGIVVHNCTNHTIAKGKRRPTGQMDLFGDNLPDEAEERSRATMWDVPRFAEYHGYDLVIVENVVDARDWIMWDAWLLAMKSLGYEHKCVYFNSMFALPTPQSRDRMYVIFWKKGNKAPDLEFKPLAYCQPCRPGKTGAQPAGTKISTYTLARTAPRK